MGHINDIFRTPLEANLNIAFQAIPHDEQRTQKYSITLFPQWWGSTNCGFGGIGGQSCVTAMTMVVKSKTKAVVFIREKWAHEFDLTDTDEAVDFECFFLKQQFPGQADYKTKSAKKHWELHEKVQQKLKKKDKK